MYWSLLLIFVFRVPLLLPFTNLLASLLRRFSRFSLRLPAEDMSITSFLDILKKEGSPLPKTSR